MDNSKYQPNDLLGVNKLGKNIRKSPLQPSFTNNATKQQPQPHVYNVSKNDFRSFVQQLTGSSSQSQEPLPRPPQNPPKPQSQRLQKIKPPPLTPVNSPLIPPQVPVEVPAPAPIPSPVPLPPQAAESPISAYMRYLQAYIIDPSPVRGQVQPQPQPPVPYQSQTQPPSSGLLPNPPMPPFPSPSGVNGHLTPIPNILSPRMNGPAFSQFLLPSPTGFPNFLSPRSPYLLLSPGVQFPSMTPRFPFSPRPQ
ncbi:hypothetical protein SLEP1_g22024 [Rubroshorea leprosula]|uniref:VQ domain-containing protein n=1 Tax=Rubroshorea leprosula TaxID=152421 RepID=A0AAV5JDZ5_9ROSI|nr:hypothetical protein SLEP1_g22024 [Rubroshorea leprosula]